VIILGSASPRRREILESLDISHVVFVASIDEELLPVEAPGAYLVRIVRAKLAAVRVALPEGLRAARAILVADTSVIATSEGGAVLGKPRDEADSFEMLTRLAGTTHEVHTRFALASLDEGGFLHEQTVRTKVSFRPVTPARLRAYAATGEGMDKAGAYAIQGRGAALVSHIEGSYSNVVGLPACEVSVALESLSL
jgi:septum formation protein